LQDLIHQGDVSPEIAQGLLALKNRIDAAKLPPSKLDETINVAVWVNREFAGWPNFAESVCRSHENLRQMFRSEGTSIPAQRRS
jgi:hypothetical protein